MDPSEKAQELAVASVIHACSYLAEEPQLMATLIVDTDVEKNMPLHAPDQPACRGAVPMLAQDPEPLRAKVVSCANDYDAYAIVFDAVLHGDQGDTNGVIAEVGVKGEDTAWRFAQPYRPVTEEGGFERLGNIVVLEQVDHLLPDS